MIGSQITNTKILPDTFLEPYNCNNVPTDSDTLSSSVTTFSCNHGFAYECYERQQPFTCYAQIHILMCPVTMKLKFWAASVMSPQLFNVNSCLGITGLKMVIDNSESVVEVVSSITDDDTKQLFTE